MAFFRALIHDLRKIYFLAIYCFVMSINCHEVCCSQETVTFIDDLRVQCEAFKQDIQPPDETKLQSAKQSARQRLLKFAEEFHSQRISDRSLTKNLSSPFLRELIDSLSEQTPDMALLENSRNKLHKMKTWHRDDAFQRMMSELDYFYLLKQACDNPDYVSEMEYFYTELPNLVEKYDRDADAETCIALTEALQFLEESRQQTDLAKQIKDFFYASNLKLRMNASILQPVFERSMNEDVDVRENIFGTQVSGSGSFSGKTSLVLVPSERTARIRLLLESETITNTVGVNGPARIWSDNVIAATTQKDFLFSPKEGLLTNRATTEATIDSRIRNINFRSGPIIRQIGTNQIYERKPASEAESLRRAKRRVNQRVDQEADAAAAKINERFGKLTEPDGIGFNRTGISILGAKTTNSELFLNTLVASDITLVSARPSPTFSSKADFYLQVHQSALHNNTAALAKTTVNEKDFFEQLRKAFPNLMKSTEKTEGETDQQSTLTIEFGAVPIDISLKDNRIVIKVNTESIRQNQVDYPGMEIVFTYKINNKKGKILLEPEEIQAVPLGFDLEVNKMSVREQTIRTVILKRLRKLTEKPIELETLHFNDSKMNLSSLKPIHFETRDGWLSIGLNAVPKEDNLAGRHYPGYYYYFY